MKLQDEKTNDRRWRRATTALLISLVLALSASFAPAQSKLQTNRGGDRDQVQNVIAIIGKSMKGCLKMEVSAILGDSPGQTVNVGYKKGTLADAINELGRMLMAGRMLKDHIDGVRLKKGKGGVAILVLPRTLVSDLRSVDPKKRVLAKIKLGNLLVRKIALLRRQIRRGVDRRAQLCDSHRDAARLQEKFLCGLLPGLQMPNGMPHTTAGGVQADADRINQLSTCYGGMSNADVAAVYRTVFNLKEEMKKKRMALENATANGQNWARLVKRALWANNVQKHPDKRLAQRDGATLEDDQHLASRFYNVPPGELLTQAVAYSNGNDQTMFIMSSFSTGTGQHVLHFFADTDGDGLPEAAPAAPPQLIPPTGGDPGIDGVGLYLMFSGVLGLGGNDVGLFIHDAQGGALASLELDPATGLPLAGPQIELQDPLISEGGGFDHFVYATKPQPGIVRFIFASDFESDHPGIDPAIWFETDGVSPPVAFTAPGQTRAQALAPFNVPGVVDGYSELLTVDFQLTGNPGVNVGLELLVPPALPLLNAPIFVDGRSGSILNPQPFPPNRHYRLNDGTDVVDTFVPRIGGTIDEEKSDEDNDTVEDCLDLTMAPPRLHFSQGIDPIAGTRQHGYELVLESELPSFLTHTWSSGTRQIVGLDRDLDLTLLPGSVPPLYVQSIVDLDGDASANESCIIREQEGNPGFFVEIIFGVSTAPMPVQVIPLAPTFVPGRYTFVDAEADGDLDICVTELGNDAGGLFIENDGLGNFTLSANAPAYPGSNDDLFLFSFVGDEPSCRNGRTPVSPGDDLSIFIESPGGTFDFRPLLVVGQFFTTGFPPQGPLAFPELHINPTGIPAPFLLINGGVPTPLGPGEVVLPGGNLHSYLVPPGLSGFSLMTQALVSSPAANNGIFAVSDGVEVIFK